MLTNVHEKQTEQLAKKHGRALNQKSSFTNLLKGKIVRSQRNADDKENEKTHMAVQIKSGQTLNQTNPLKIKEKTNAVVLISQKSLKSEGQMANKRRKEVNRNTHESSIQTVSEASQYHTFDHESSKITPSNMGFENTMKLQTFENEPMVQAECMTDECYYQQQLQIKVSILKKERDQLWDSINGIVRQNNLLKETLESISLVKSSAVSQTTQTETKSYTSQGYQTVQIEQVSQGFQTDIIHKQTVCFQTDNIEHPSIIMQTDMSSDQLQLIQLRYQKAMQERLQVLQFCETLCLQDISEQLSECLNMKQAISEYLGMKIDGLVKQFDSQKAMLNRMYEEYINKFKKNEEDLLERNQSLLIELQQVKSCCKKMQEMAEINERKLEMLQESNYIMNNELIEAEEEIEQYKKQAELIKESLVSEKAIWQQKKNTYTSLLAASHKTINNLMYQMKEFEGLASYNHSKRLKNEKNDHSIIHDI